MRSDVMNDRRSEDREGKVCGAKSPWVPSGVLGAVCALIVAVYAVAIRGTLESALSISPAMTHYNLLVQGLRAGQLSLKKEVPAGLAQLPDPYDPTANAPYRSPPYRMLDLSYYKGRLYLYFGISPALLLFWPYAALTGHYLFDRQAIAIFCALGFLASVALLRALWRRYFAEVSVWVVAACALALGLATGIPMLLSRSEVYEVPISCGYMLTMLALGALWCALQDSQRRGWWLAAASLAYGLAVGARPNLVFGAIILLVPIAQAWRQRKPIAALLVAAVVPITLIGVGLMLYNAGRFDNPFEFGWRYELDPGRQDRLQLFSLRYLLFNLRVYFLEPARWSSRFPFVREIAMPPLPAGHHGNLQGAYGVLTNIPLVWLSLAVPLAWRGRSAVVKPILRWFVATVTLLAGICALTLGFFFAAGMRYEVEFLPALVLLAVVGILGLERALADRALWRCTARWGWGLLLAFSVAFNLLACVENYADTHYYRGITLFEAGKVQEAIQQYEQAIRLKPDFASAYNNLGSSLQQAGKLAEAISYYKRALQIEPNNARLHYNLAIALEKVGDVPGAIGQYEQAIRINPDDVDAHNNLGNAHFRAGRRQDAIQQYEQALRINPDSALAHYNLAVALEQAGNAPGAIGQYEQSLWIDPSDAQVHFNLGAALEHLGRHQEAIDHFEQALRINPKDADARNNLGFVLMQVGKVQEAIGQYEEALRINPSDARAHFNLGVILEGLGRHQEAIGHYEQALQVNPDMAEAQRNLERLRTVQRTGGRSQ